ncbi:MAG: sodium:proton antiporter [Thermodesulfobacteriota bacterium]
MKKIILFSSFLIIGLVLSQVLPTLLPAHTYDEFAHIVKLLTTIMLGFIMIRVGYEFELDKTRLRSYGWDYIVAATAATFPWILVAMYFVFVLSTGDSLGLWSRALLTSRFASPTSAGVLFSMLAAAGLTGTWMYRKIKVLAIFDDLDTVILMVPLKVMLVGLKWQLIVVLAPMIIFLLAAWRYLHRLRFPVTWYWVLGYSLVITLSAEAIYLASKLIDEVVTIHIEVLLPAFVLGCMMAHQKISPGDGQTRVDITEMPGERLMTVVVSAVFMLLVGLSMPPVMFIAGTAAEVKQADIEVLSAYMVSEDKAIAQKAVPVPPSPAVLQEAPLPEKSPGLPWTAIAFHVLMVTLLSNFGKLFPFFCYKKEAHWRERLALAVGMFPRGEVGAGVLIISISYGIGGAMLTVAMLSLALNLLLTGVFIVAVKKLLNSAAVLEGV